ncbi:MAG TPA: hypothetical protein EYN96_11745 [Candidatus Hydrogenedentes bacterium]|nr:hypothetical protein [Candidatus Hydrogenedentota bacterium]
MIEGLNHERTNELSILATYRRFLNEKDQSIMEILIGPLLALVIGIIIGRDAASRGMSGIGWGLFTFLICIIAIPIYLIVRKPRLES